MVFEILQLESFSPVPLVQIHQHGLLELRLSVGDGNGVIMPVQAMNQSLNTGFVDMTDIGCCLAGLLAHDDTVRVDESEGVDHDLALD